ncbi:MAG: 3'(2'),5'-bisphosphate nucleotidase [Planctomycetota bacterium]
MSHSDDAWRNERELAVAAVRHASRLTRAVQAAWTAEQGAGKQDGSPVTIADYGAQAIIGRYLAAAFPHDTVVAEESSQALRDEPALLAQLLPAVSAVDDRFADADSLLRAIDQGAPASDDAPLPARYWTIDPVDGTRGFVRGEHYSVVLALIDNGRVVVGAMGCPGMPREGTAIDQHAPDDGVIFSATLGGGATMEPTEQVDASSGGATRVAVSASMPGDARYRACESVEAGHTDPTTAAAIYRHAGLTVDPLRMDGQGKYGLVARGDVAVYLRVHHKPRTENIWDHAAGVLIVTEAGGRVSDFAGNAIDWTAGRRFQPVGGILVTNGVAHDRLLKSIADVRNG